MKLRIAFCLFLLILVGCDQAGTAEIAGTPYVFSFMAGAPSATATPVAIEAPEPQSAPRKWDRMQWWGDSDAQLRFQTGPQEGWILHWAPVNRGCKEPGSLDVYLGKSATANVVLVSDPKVLANFQCSDDWRDAQGLIELAPSTVYFMRLAADGQWLVDLRPPPAAASGRTVRQSPDRWQR